MNTSPQLPAEALIAIDGVPFSPVHATPRPRNTGGNTRVAAKPRSRSAFIEAIAEIMAMPVPAPGGPQIPGH